MFFTGVSPSMVRWEVSYEGKSFKKKWKFGPGRNFVKCSKLVREAPRATQKIKKKLTQKGPGPNLGPGQKSNFFSKDFPS